MSPSPIDHPLERPVVLVLLWAGAVAVVAALVGHFWIPLDDGTLAQCAERVLHGQLPQRDFGDPYSGLNAVLGALAFRLFGERLLSLRIPLVAGFALWLPAIWILCRRFATAPVALAGTALAAVLSVLAYPAAMPTWFVLFLVTWGVVAVLRFQDGGAVLRGGFTGRDGRSDADPGAAADSSGQHAPKDADRGTEGDSSGPPPAGRAGGSRTWLLLAGAAAGTGILFKVVGLYFLAAILLAMARWRAGGRILAWLILAGVGAFTLVVGRLLLPTGGAGAFLQLFVPVTALAFAVGIGGWRRRDQAAPGATRALLLDAAALLVGVTAPMVVYLVPYASGGGVRAWIEGVFILPRRRLATAASAASPAWTVLPGLAAVALVWVSGRLTARARASMALALAALLAIGFAADDASGGAVFGAFWYAARTWLPALTLWAAWLFAREPRTHADAFVVVATAVLWSLVQFPYPAPAYFFYVAPLVVPATLAVVRASRRRPGPVLGMLAGLFLYLGAGYVTGVVSSGTTLLPGDRAGIRVRDSDARLYGALADTVRAHAGGGGLWATPDAPEVYFLSGLANPTSTIYEFLDPTPLDSSSVAAMLDAHDVRVVVLNTRPLFSRPTPPPVLRLVRERYPRGDTVGPFVVRWSPGP